MKKGIAILILLSIAIAAVWLSRPVKTNKPHIEKTQKVVYELKSTNEENTGTSQNINTTTSTVEKTVEEPKKSNEEIADEIIKGLWVNGESRKELLIEAGYDYEAIQKIVESKLPKQKPVKQTYIITNSSGCLTKSGGVSFNNPLGLKETWYSQRVLPGGGLNIPGRHVDSRGFVCDIDGYICLAINNTYYPKGTIVQTSNGLGKVYDNCPSFYNGKPVIDVYVDWS